MKRLVLTLALAASSCVAASSCSLAVSTSGLSDGVRANDAGASDGAQPVEAGAAEGGSDASSLDPDLVAWWKFDETGGSVAKDATGNGNDAVLAIGATFDPSGHRGGCLRLVDTSRAVVERLGGTAFPRSGTIAIWYRYSFAADDQEERGIFDHWDKNRAHVFVRRANGSSTSGRFQIALQSLDPNGYPFDMGYTLAPNTWAHVVVTWDEGNARGAAYLNGTLLAADPYVSPFLPEGQDVRFGVNFAGDLDEARLWKRALTAAEVAALD